MVLQLCKIASRLFIYIIHVLIINANFKNLFIKFWDEESNHVLHVYINVKYKYQQWWRDCYSFWSVFVVGLWLCRLLPSPDLIKKKHLKAFSCCQFTNLFVKTKCKFAMNLILVFSPSVYVAIRFYFLRHHYLWWKIIGARWIYYIA